MMTDDRPNWTRYWEARAVRIHIQDLIDIGVTLGPDVAERCYYSLAQEPRDAQGDRIDWTVIRAAITAQRNGHP